MISHAQPPRTSRDAGPTDSPASTARGAKRDGFRARDVLAEAIMGLAGRPGRLILTALVVVLGIGSLVAVVGLGQTGSRQVQARFDAVAARHGVVRSAADSMGMIANPATLPWDAGERAERLNGVVAAGTVSDLNLTGAQITAAPLFDPMAPPTRQPLVYAATPDLLEAVAGRLQEGTWIDNFHEQRSERVAVLGARAAQLLGVMRVDNQPAVFIGSTSFTVIGIVDHVEYAGELLDAVILPQSTARTTFGLAQPGELHVRLELAAGPLIAEQIGLQLDTTNPQGYDIIMPPPPSQMRENLAADVNSLFFILALVALALGGLTISIVSTMSVMERRGEIGLRRAIGATRTQVAAQFITECAIIGLLGAIIGAAAGILTVTAVSAANQWNPVLDLRLVGVAILAGVLVGAASGLLPAIRAARLEPAQALQEGT